MIELDVTLSRDRKVVVIHDPKLDRTTNGKGKVADFTLAQLKQLDAGSWFDPRFADQRIPELSEVLDLVDGRICVNIEIKSDVYEAHHPPDAIEKQIIELLRQKQLLGASLISSFEGRFLEQIALMDDAPALVFISNRAAGSKTVQTCNRLNVFSWHPNKRIVTPKVVKLMHDAGVKVLPYTVNTQKDFARMMGMQVDGVITDDPVVAGQWSEIQYKA